MTFTAYRDVDFLEAHFPLDQCEALGVQRPKNPQSWPKVESLHIFDPKLAAAVIPGLAGRERPITLVANKRCKLGDFRIGFPLDNLPRIQLEEDVLAVDGLSTQASIAPAATVPGNTRIVARDWGSVSLRFIFIEKNRIVSGQDIQFTDVSWPSVLRWNEKRSQGWMELGELEDSLGIKYPDGMNPDHKKASIRRFSDWVPGVSVLPDLYAPIEVDRIVDSDDYGAFLNEIFGGNLRFAMRLCLSDKMRAAAMAYMMQSE